MSSKDADAKDGEGGRGAVKASGGVKAMLAQLNSKYSDSHVQLPDGTVPTARVNIPSKKKWEKPSSSNGQSSDARGERGGGGQGGAPGDDTGGVKARLAAIKMQHKDSFVRLPDGTIPEKKTAPIVPNNKRQQDAAGSSSGPGGTVAQQEDGSQGNNDENQADPIDLGLQVEGSSEGSYVTPQEADGHGVPSGLAEVAPAQRQQAPVQLQAPRQTGGIVSYPREALESTTEQSSASTLVQQQMQQQMQMQGAMMTPQGQGQGQGQGQEQYDNSNQPPPPPALIRTPAQIAAAAHAQALQQRQGGPYAAPPPQFPPHAQQQQQQQQQQPALPGILNAPIAPVPGAQGHYLHGGNQAPHQAVPDDTVAGNYSSGTWGAAPDGGFGEYSTLQMPNPNAGTSQAQNGGGYALGQEGMSAPARGDGFAHQQHQSEQEKAALVLQKHEVMSPFMPCPKDKVEDIVVVVVVVVVIIMIMIIIMTGLMKP